MINVNTLRYKQLQLLSNFYTYLNHRIIIQKYTSHLKYNLMYTNCHHCGNYVTVYSMFDDNDNYYYNNK